MNHLDKLNVLLRLGIALVPLSYIHAPVTIAVLAMAQHVTVVLVTHDPYEATTLCRSVLLLENGHVEEAGTWKDLLGNPRSEMLWAFRAHMGRTIPVSL